MREALQKLIDALHGEPRSTPVEQAYQEADNWLKSNPVPAEPEPDPDDK